MWTHVRPALVATVVFTLITGAVYPLVVTGISQLLFPRQANGSLIEIAGKPVGSELIGQPFSAPKYFWSRASATSPYPYNAAASSGSNQGPLNPLLGEAVTGRIKALADADADADTKQPVPVDLVTASASGLDPHISPAAAEHQVSRVARARAIAPERVRALVVEHTEGRQFGVLGEPRVNVLKLNLALDLTSGRAPPARHGDTALQ